MKESLCSGGQRKLTLLPSSVVKVNNERVISKLLKSLIVMAIHITWAESEETRTLSRENTMWSTEK